MFLQDSLFAVITEFNSIPWRKRLLIIPMIQVAEMLMYTHKQTHSHVNVQRTG